MSDTPTPKTDSEAELTLIDCDDSCIDIYVKRNSKIVDGDIVLADFARQLERELNEANKELHQKYIEFDDLFDEAEQIRIERDEALAANAELLERLQEARESYLIATAKKVQTIQQQAVEIDRLKSALADIYSLSRS